MAKDRVGVHGTDEEVGKKRTFKKTECNISEEEFFSDQVKPLKLRIQICNELGEALQEQVVIAFPVKFKPDKDEKYSFGFRANDKITFELIPGRPVKLQGNNTFIVIGSKEK